MFKYSKDGVSILTVQDTRRKKQSGLFPIKIQVVYKRTQRYYNTGKELNTEEWEALPDTKSKRLIAIRSDIKNSFDKVEDAVQSLVEDGSFSFEVLNMRLGKGLTDTLNTAFQAKIDSLLEAGAVGTQLPINVHTGIWRNMQEQTFILNQLQLIGSKSTKRQC